jgi:hypothetical protein
MIGRAHPGAQRGNDPLSYRRHPGWLRLTECTGPSAEHEDAGRDKGESERNCGREQSAFLRQVSAMGASDAISSVGRGLEFHIAFP